MAKGLYVLESRRVQAEFTILEEHVGTQMRMDTSKIGSEEVTAEYFSDSMGIGCYRINLHPFVGGTNYIDVSSLPFQIPLGALVPKRVDNLLAASKISAPRIPRMGATDCTRLSGISEKR